ncbi:hypothetical protein [Yoonia sp. BS5-3]|uniref:Uncharacterized protein n=1 Tax=Yoonia phaeophyticola TaxID=3137369 RepID=A0ABZ2V699_9RHOB
MDTAFATVATCAIGGLVMGVVTNNAKMAMASLIAGGLIAFATGLISFHAVRVILDRGLGTVTVTQTYFRKTDQISHQLTDMIEANIWKDLSLILAYKGVRPPPNLALIFATADPPDIHILPSWRTGESAIVAVANSINAWLSMDVDSQPPQA